VAAGRHLLRLGDGQVARNMPREGAGGTALDTSSVRCIAYLALCRVRGMLPFGWATAAFASCLPPGATSALTFKRDGRAVPAFGGRHIALGPRLPLTPLPLRRLSFHFL